MLAVSVTARRIGYVFLVGNRLMGWRVVRKAAKTKEQAVEALQKWINKYKPDVVVTEHIPDTSRKGHKTRSVIEALQRLASNNYVLDILIGRAHPHLKRHEEATLLAGLYPDVRPWLPPKRRVQDDESRYMVLFEALSFAHSVLQRPKAALF